MNPPSLEFSAAAGPRLLIFVANLQATGVVRNAIAIANAAASAGYSVDLVTCRADGALADRVAPYVNVIELLEKRHVRLSRPAQLLACLRAYRAYLRAELPDLLFSAGNHAHLISRLAWAGVQRPRVYRISNELRGRGTGLKRGCSESCATCNFVSSPPEPTGSSQYPGQWPRIRCWNGCRRARCCTFPTGRTLARSVTRPDAVHPIPG